MNYKSFLLQCIQNERAKQSFIASQRKSLIENILDAYRAELRTLKSTSKDLELENRRINAELTGKEPL